MAKVISQLPSGGSVPKHNNLLGLNEGDYLHLTQSEKAKLDGIQSGAEVNVNTDWNAISGDAQILNKPASFPPSTHTHTISEVINLQNELNSKENISNKVNTISGNSSTEYPTEKAVVDYVSSELNLLKNPDRITENTGFTLVGQDITMNSLWKGVISGVEYSNPTSQVINLPLSTVANTRADIIVLTKNNNFIRVQGVESTTNPPIPSVPNDTLLAVTVIVNDSSVGNITNPISGDEYVKKIEFGNVLLTGSGVINQLNLVDEKATIVFKGSVTRLNTISYASVPYNGKRITLFNAQATPVTIGHSVSGYGIDFVFPDAQDYVLVPNQTIEFSFDITYAPYAHHMLIGAVVDSQIEVNSSRSVSNLWNGKTVLFTANCTITVPATLLPQFGFVFRTLAGVTVTWAITAPFTWETTPTTTPEKTTGSFMRRGNTNTILLDF